MNRVVLLLPFVLGCKLIAGIDDTSVIPDATPPDARIPDAPLDLPFDVGSGLDGPLDVDGTMYTDANRTRVITSTGAGATRVEVADVGDFRAGDEIVLIQMSGPDAGHYETHRIATVGTDHFILQTTLAANFDVVAARVQAIRVPNYSRVAIPVDATLTAHAWDEAAGTGGVVFFRSTGQVTIEGALRADALGFPGGAPGSVAPVGGPGGAGGSAGGRANCPLTCGALVFAGFGGPGQVAGETGADGAPGGRVGNCSAGYGGRGGIGGQPGGPLAIGQSGIGEGGGAGTGQGGRQVATEHARPILGGGGGAGPDGAGGLGGGGGGGGGGPMTASNPVSGTQGQLGQGGGVGGLGGGGGPGGGILVVNALAIDVAAGATISASGASGTGGGAGGLGGTGGAGGYGTTFGEQQACGGARLYGGRGGGGVGATGGDGGGGGGGGGGGSIVLNVNTMTVGATATIVAVGGAASSEGIGGEGGEGGEATFPGAMGPSGVAGAAGTPGTAGVSFIRHVAGCTGCEIGDPPATVTTIEE